MRFGVPMQRERDRVKRRASSVLVERLAERRLETAVDVAAAAVSVAVGAAADAEAAETIAEAAQVDADQALLDAAAAQTAADAASVLATDASADAAAAVLDVMALADGTTPFTALNVAGTDVAPFLGQTDGTRIVNRAAFDSGLISVGAEAFTDASLAWSGSGYDVAQTANITTDGGKVTVSAGLIASASTTGVIFSLLLEIQRDGVSIWGPYTVAQAVPDGLGNNVLFETIDITITDQPAAGAYDYDLLFSYTSTGGARNVRSRSLVLREQRAE